jgi:hypothetical protein
VRTPSRTRTTLTCRCRGVTTRRARKRRRRRTRTRTASGSTATITRRRNGNGRRWSLTVRVGRSSRAVVFLLFGFSEENQGFSSLGSPSQHREPRTCVLRQRQERTPLQRMLDQLLGLLEKKDPQQFFAWPVTDSIAPGYSSIISQPMDISTMRQKIEDNQYDNLQVSPAPARSLPLTLHVRFPVGRSSSLTSSSCAPTR